MKRLLVTGGTGFLGKHVVDQMKFAPPMDFVTPRSIDLDLTDRAATLKYFAAYRPTTILHMAALCGGILANKNSPADFLHKNVDMASNLYEAAKSVDCKNIYTLGSVCAYPKFCPTPFREDNLWDGYPEETNAPYGMAKRLLLMMSQTYRQQYDFTGAHLIPVNMYGEHDHFDLTNSHVIPALINKFVAAIENRTTYVECWGSGEATREFLYAGDCAEALVRAVSGGLDCVEPINLGTGQDILIRDLAELIKELTGFTGNIVYNGAVSDGQPRRVLDVSRAKNNRTLQWKAKTKLRDGLVRTIDWYRKTK